MIAAENVEDEAQNVDSKNNNCNRKCRARSLSVDNTRRYPTSPYLNFAFNLTFIYSYIFGRGFHCFVVANVSFFFSFLSIVRWIMMEAIPDHETWYLMETKPNAFDFSLMFKTFGVCIFSPLNNH